jgi:hypothetical protein
MIVPMAQAQLIVTINVFQDASFLRDQLRNIDTYLDPNLQWCPILNCSVAFLEELKNTDLFQYCNPISIDKRRFHGSILKGVVHNIKYALDCNGPKGRPVFQWVLVMSARTRFAKVLLERDICRLLQRFPKQPPSFFFNGLPRNVKWWHWPKITRTAISQTIEDDHRVGGRHEGLLLTRNACDHVVQRMVSQIDAYDENCAMEEWVLQSLSMECGEPFLQLAFWINWFNRSPLVVVDAPWKPSDDSNSVVVGIVVAFLALMITILMIMIRCCRKTRDSGKVTVLEHHRFS